MSYLFPNVVTGHSVALVKHNPGITLLSYNEYMTPDEYTIKEFQLKVSDGHELYVYDWGNKSANAPIIQLHGGPGGCNKDHNKEGFDPKIQRVIFYDQRGCGRSTPYGELKNNTTTDLVEDLELIAKKLKLKSFIINGGSWGSTLALAYALTYPKRVHALVIQGVFTGSSKEIQYLDSGLFRTHFPDAWERFLSITPAKFHADPTAYHFPRVLGNDQVTAATSGQAYEQLEGSVARLDDRLRPQTSDDEPYNVAPIRTEVHYMVNGCFMKDRHILDNAHKLKMPLWIIQGRYDFVCPPYTAYELSKKAPNSHLIWTEAGHSRSDRQNYDIIRTIILQASLEKS